MPSPPELKTAAENVSRAPTGPKIWKRKLHYYVGLYFLFFVWLFALARLLLNHSWSFPEFWQTRTINVVQVALLAR